MPFDAGGREYPYVDSEIQSMVVGHAGPNGDFMVSVTPMIFNDRIMVTHRSNYPLGVDAGFCYDKGLIAPVYAEEWVLHWDEMDVPNGFKKEAFNRLPHYGKGKVNVY